jgi:hypothetical protein
MPFWGFGAAVVELLPEPDSYVALEDMLVD